MRADNRVFAGRTGSGVYVMAWVSLGLWLLAGANAARAQTPEPTAPVQGGSSAAPTQEPPSEGSSEVVETRPATTKDYAAGELPPDVRIVPPETIPPYSAEDSRRLREIYDLPPIQNTEPRRPRWRCLIADPACGHSLEITALSAYARRMHQKQHASADGGASRLVAWNSARVDYSVQWLAPAVVRVRDFYKVTVIGMGMQGGVVVSDSSEVWGKMGFASRFWLGEGAWSPAIDFQAGVSFKLRGTDRQGLVSSDRSPMGFYGDVGFNVGGFGAIVIGGQYETPLARIDIPAVLRRSPGGSFFVGFRGNIFWGVPLAAAITSQALAQRRVTRP